MCPGEGAGGFVDTGDGVCVFVVGFGLHCVLRIGLRRSKCVTVCVWSIFLHHQGTVNSKSVKNGAI